MLVLHLEDDPTYAGLVKEMLLALPVTLVQTADTTTALAWLHDHHPDLIITDIAMRGPINGLALIETLRRQPAYQTLPIIIVSAIDAPSVRLQALELGVAAYLPKPIRWRALLAAVSDALPAIASSPVRGSDVFCKI